MSANKIQEGIGRSASGFRLPAVLIIAVCIVVCAVHWPALSAKVMFFDDDQYLTNNSLVQSPGWSSVRRFLSEVLEPSTVQGYYQPLAMISLMTDYALGGRVDNLRQFHRTSLCLHAANTALVVVLLYLLLGNIWAAAGMGLLFGIHPMTVEPICWISDRKTLLAAFFTIGAIIFYVLFTRKRDWKLYVGSIVWYVPALMSKPISISLPVLLLILDYWPLRRLRWRSIVEKSPFFVIGAVFAVIMYISQIRTCSVVLPNTRAPASAVMVLCHNIIFYLHKVFWPAKLSSYYPYPVPLALSNPTILAALVGTGILILLLVISLRWTRAILAGWLFFFIAIFPAMGVIGFSFVIAADKFAYLPSIGLLITLAWLVSLVSNIGRFGKTSIGQIAVIAILLISAGAETSATRRYLSRWRDTAGFCEYMLTLTPDAALVHYNLGLALQSGNRRDEAINHYRQALQAKPNYADAHNNLGIVLQLQGRLTEALSHYHQAVQANPEHIRAYNNIGIVLQLQGKPNEAIDYYHRSLQLKGDYAEARYNLAMTLQSQGKLAEALSQYRQTLQLLPNDVDTHNNLGLVLQLQGKLDEAVSYYRRALQLKPDYAKAHYNLGLALKLQGKFDEAISHYQQALKLMPNDVGTHYNIGLAFKLQGKFDEAIGHFRRVLRSKPNHVICLNNLAQILITHPDENKRDSEQAIVFAERAAKLTRYKDAVTLDTLAAAYAAAGRFDEAVKTAEAALELASADKNEKLTLYIKQKIELYNKQMKP